MSEFIVYCTSKEAKAVITEHNQVLKSMQDKKVFVEALSNPPAPSEKLRKAYSNYLKNQFAHGAGNKEPEQE